MPENARVKAAVSVSEMAKMVGLSRARFYELIERGVFTRPVHALTTKRPFFTAELQQVNLEVRQSQQGLNGEFVLFYQRQEQGRARRAVRRSRQSSRHGEHADLIHGLRSLGIDPTAAEVAQAIESCFPGGTNGTDQSTVLRDVFRHLRCSNGA